MLGQPDGSSVDQLSKRKSQESAVGRAGRGGGGVGGLVSTLVRMTSLWVSRDRGTD